jgi:toxin FitB
MNIIDSSCWLEYFADSEIGNEISRTIEKVELLIVPSITLYEVFKKIMNERDEDLALLAVAHMKQGQVINLDSDLSIFSAKIGKEYKLALADSIIYATAIKFNCTIWTQDKHFKELNNVRYFNKESNGD